MFKDRSILLLAIGQTLIWAALYYVFPALLLRWEQELGWSKPDLTAAIALAVLISGICAPFAGRVIDAGRGPMLLGGSALLGGGGLLLLSQITALWHFYVVWAFIGLAMSGCLYEPCFALVTHVRGRNAKRGIIFITLAAGFAGTISYPAVYTLADAFGWRAAVAVLGAVVIFAVAPILWFGASGLAQDGGRARATLRVSQATTHPKSTVLKQPAFWFLAAGFTCIAITNGAIVQHLLPILNEAGLSDEMAILAASLIGPMQVLGRLAVMQSEKFLSHRSVAIGTFASLALAILLLRITPEFPALLIGFVVFFGTAYGVISILRPLMARELLGEAGFGAISGALALPYLVGAAFSPYLAALLWGLGGYALVLTMLFICVVTGAGLFYAATRLAHPTG